MASIAIRRVPSAYDRICQNESRVASNDLERCDVSQITFFISFQLSQFGASPKVTCDNGYYPIHEAAKNASANAIEALLEWGKSGFNVLTFILENTLTRKGIETP